MKVYAVNYYDCIHDFQIEVLSLHKTKMGAYRAMRRNKLQSWDVLKDDWEYHSWSIVEHKVNQEDEKRL